MLYDFARHEIGDVRKPYGGISRYFVIKTRIKGRVRVPIPDSTRLVRLTVRVCGDGRERDEGN